MQVFDALSIIRTITVGSGVSPDLLSPKKHHLMGARGLKLLKTVVQNFYRRWGISPRPENEVICHNK